AGSRRRRASSATRRTSSRVMATRPSYRTAPGGATTSPPRGVSAHHDRDRLLGNAALRGLRESERRRGDAGGLRSLLLGRIARLWPLGSQQLQDRPRRGRLRPPDHLVGSERGRVRLGVGEKAREVVVTSVGETPPDAAKR